MINTTNLLNGSENVMIDATLAVNVASGGVFGYMLVFSMYIIMFVFLARYGSKVAFSTTAFVGAMITMLLRLLGIVNDTVFYLTIILVVIAVLILYNSKD